MPRPFARLLPVALLAASAGCGDPYKLVTVTGTVTTCQGKPAVGGTVEFWPADAPDKTGRPAGQPGRGSRGVVGPDGRFTLQAEPYLGRTADGVLLGPHRVVFIPPPTSRPVLTPLDRKVLQERGPTALKDEEDRLAALPVFPPLPCSDKISPATVEVTASGDHFDFTLPK